MHCLWLVIRRMHGDSNRVWSCSLVLRSPRYIRRGCSGSSPVRGTPCSSGEKRCSSEKFCCLGQHDRVRCSGRNSDIPVCDNAAQWKRTFTYTFLISRRLAQNQSTERPLKVLDDILHVLYPHREPDEPRRNPGCSPLFVALVSMYHGSRMRDQCFHPSQTHCQQA